MPFGYPVFLELAGRHAVVIGETAVREGKVEGLLAADVGSVTVVAERPAARLDSLAALDERVTVERRAWRPADLDGAFVCVASSDDPAERAAVAREARDRGVLVNVMDDIPNCDWAAPSIVRRGELVIAISTGGASPALAKKLRLQLSAAFGEEWAEVLAVLRDVRAATMPFLPDIGERASRWASALDTAEAATLVREGRADELRERLVRRLLEDAPIAARTGIVYLVGAGPGDPTLITVRGSEVLGRADVVVYDRLASPGAARSGADHGRAHLRRQGTGPIRDAAGRDRRAAGRTRARRSDGGAAEGRGPVRVRPRRRGDARVHRGRRRLSRSCPASRARSRRRRWRGSRSRIEVSRRASRSSRAAPRTATRWISLASPRPPTRSSC